MSQVVNADVVAVDAVVAPVVKAPRNPNVSDEAIITAWETMAVRKDANGELNGSIQEVADQLGMKKASLVQRVQSLKPIVKLSKLPRQKSTGSGGKKKDPQSVLEILARVRASLATPAPEAPTA
jgi:hypothetical protein